MKKPREQASSWPNEKMLWYRFIACLVVGFCAATGLFMGVVMLLDFILSK